MSHSHFVFPRLFCLCLAVLTCALLHAEEGRPNILWITSEDHGPHLGAYGDSYAHTPNLDEFAKRSLRYDVAWSDAPVCAPARTSIITGVYPTSTGGHHMRSDVRLPSLIQPYPQILRQAGYYCTNNRKEDYNISGSGKIWDESSPRAHYRNRKEGQPFFAVFNFHESHESRVRDRTELPHHDPAKAPLPPYYPDAPEIRRDWAQYYHGIHLIDQRVGEILDELEAENLADDTIVFFYSDHGSGMPRQKRWPYNAGLQVPLIVHIPEKYRALAPDDYEAGGQTRRPAGFVDLAPTLLSLIGLEAPPWMQGRAFAGEHEAEPRQYLFGLRGRMDERADMVRSVRNDRYVYVRNYMPHLIYGQYLSYMFLTETTRVWQALYRDGKLQPPQTAFWEPKPAEELYDLLDDPHEVKDLADSSEHQPVLRELREAHRRHALEIRDAGFLPEAEMHRRAGDTTVYEMSRDPDQFPLEEILAMAELAAARDSAALPRLLSGLGHEDPAIRYWSAMGILIRGGNVFDASKKAIRRALHDANPDVCIVAGQILVENGSERERQAAISRLLDLARPDVNGAYVAFTALTVIADLDDESLDRIRPRLEQMELKDPAAPARVNDYVHRHVTAALARESPSSKGPPENPPN